MNLKQELNNTLADINHQLKVIVDDATTRNPGIAAVQLLDANGNYILVPLLLAKATVLSALVNLKE